MTITRRKGDLEWTQHLATLAARPPECQQIQACNSQFLLTL
jgi:hypothetical protein